MYICTIESRQEVEVSKWCLLEVFDVWNGLLSAIVVVFCVN